jgi:branched-chain amino acid transport system ATP-binding protein
MARPGSLLQVEDIRLSFGGVTALDGITFDTPLGSVLGVIGPNGAGKTALLNSICGVYQPQQGSISFAGRSIKGLRPERVARLGIGRTFQGMDHFSEFTVINYIMLARSQMLSSSAWGAALAWPASDRAERAERDHAAEVLERCGLIQYAGQPLHEVPYGIQKQVDMARIIASDCRLVLLDEPTSGTTSSERDIISAALDLIVDAGLSVILIDHDVQFVTRHCDELLAINYGQMLATGTVEDVFSHERVREAFLGIAT